MQPSCTTMFLIWSLGSVPLTCTPRPGGSKASIMTCMFGDALSTFWRRRLRIARVFQSGSQDLFAVSTWVPPRSIQASTVPLDLNPDTGYVTPQFHIVFDDWFATVATNVYALPDFNSNHWARLFDDSRFQFPFDETDEVDQEIAMIDSDAAEVLASNQTEVAAAMDKDSEVPPLPVPPLPESELRSPASTVPSIPLETSRHPTPTSHTREPMFQEEATLNSPKKEEVRFPVSNEGAYTPRRNHPELSSYGRSKNPFHAPAESSAPTVPVSPQSPPRQPVFSPVREQTLIFETRERLQVSSPRHLHQRHLQFLFLFPLISHHVALVAREWRLLASATTEGNPTDTIRVDLRRERPDHHTDRVQDIGKRP